MKPQNKPTERKFGKEEIVVDKFIERGLFGKPEYFLTCVGSDGVEDSIKVDPETYRCADVFSRVYADSFSECKNNQTQRRAWLN